MNFSNIFRRKKMKDPVRTMRIDGVSTKMTPKPDDAELAAQALLEHLSEPKGRKKEPKAKQPKEGTPEYYQQLSGKIKEAHAAEARSALRYLSYTEEELKENPTMDQLIEIEQGLYLLQDCAEREGGELKKRWQHCLAEVIVLQTKDIPDSIDDIS